MGQKKGPFNKGDAECIHPLLSSIRRVRRNSTAKRRVRQFCPCVGSRAHMQVHIQASGAPLAAVVKQLKARGGSVWRTHTHRYCCEQCDESGDYRAASPSLRHRVHARGWPCAWGGCISCRRPCEGLFPNRVVFRSRLALLRVYGRSFRRKMLPRCSSRLFGRLASNPFVFAHSWLHKGLRWIALPFW